MRRRESFENFVLCVCGVVVLSLVLIAVVWGLSQASGGETVTIYYRPTP